MTRRGDTPILDLMMRTARKSRCWYEEGLRFACVRCGSCCRGEPGYVWVSGEEWERIAEHLGTDEEELARRCLRRVFGRLSLVELRNKSSKSMGSPEN